MIPTVPIFLFSKGVLRGFVPVIAPALRSGGYEPEASSVFGCALRPMWRDSTGLRPHFFHRPARARGGEAEPSGVKKSGLHGRTARALPGTIRIFQRSGLCGNGPGIQRGVLPGKETGVDKSRAEAGFEPLTASGNRTKMPLACG